MRNPEIACPERLGGIEEDVGENLVRKCLPWHQFRTQVRRSSNFFDIGRCNWLHLWSWFLCLWTTIERSRRSAFPRRIPRHSMAGIYSAKLRRRVTVWDLIGAILGDFIQNFGCRVIFLVGNALLRPQCPSAWGHYDNWMRNWVLSEWMIRVMSTLTKSNESKDNGPSMECLHDT